MIKILKNIVGIQTQKANELSFIREKLTGNLYIPNRPTYGNKIFDAGVENSPYQDTLQPLEIYELSDDVEPYSWCLYPNGEVVYMDNNRFVDYLDSQSNSTKKIIKTSNKKLNGVPKFTKPELEIILQNFNKIK